MIKINEVIKEIALEKADVARTSAECVDISGVIFREGVFHNAVYIDKGIDKLAEILNTTVSERYKENGADYYKKQRFVLIDGVDFIEENYIKSDDLPAGAQIV